MYTKPSDFPPGQASLVVAAEDLARTLNSLPGSYRVIGSLESRKNGQVELVVVSSDVASGGGPLPRLRVEVTDAGSTRTLRVVPITEVGLDQG